jgi:hypothetical protein
MLHTQNSDRLQELIISADPFLIGQGFNDKVESFNIRQILGSLFFSMNILYSEEL